MSDLETLRAWRDLLANGDAVVTIETHGVRYTFPHADARIVLIADVEEIEPHAARVRQYRQVGYRVDLTAGARYTGGDDCPIREVVGD